MKKIFLFHLLLVCPVIFLIWYIVFPNYLWLLEGNSFFSFTPDFAGIQLSLPSDWAQYVGAYLLQFFRFRTSGALVQMLFVLIVLLSADCIIARLTRNKGLLWLSFIPVIWFMSGQFADVLLVRSMWWCSISAVLTLLVWLLTIRRKAPVAWGERYFFSSPFFTYIVPCLLLGFIVYREVTDEKQKETEFISRIDHLAENRNWDAILQNVTPEMTKKNSSLLRWTLLALSEKGQAGILSPYGNSFRSMRAIVDACVHQGRNRMLAKYVEVMKHTSCHTKQAQLLGEYLASAGVEDKINSGKNTSPFFIGAHPFLSDMARMVDRYPENRKAVDYLLCGLLISKDVDKFYKVFSLLYKPFSVKLPRYYEEALLVLATQHPDILRRYPVGQEVVKDFNSFHALLKGGTMNQKMLEINYRDSFWLFYYCMKAVKKSAEN